MAKTTPPPVLADYADMRGGIVAVVQAARVAVARNVNALMTASYWEIGHRIVEAEQKGQRRAGYGEQLVERLAVDLTAQFGRGFSQQNLWLMRSFYLAWPIRQTLSGEFPVLSGPCEILQTPSGELEAAPHAWTLPELANAFPLPWSAYVRLLSVKSAPARQFYEAEALRGGWSVRQTPFHFAP